MPSEKDGKKDQDDSKAVSTAEEALKKLNMNDVRALFGGAAPPDAKTLRNMDAHKFWQTQPVTRFDEKKEELQEGPIEPEDPARVPKEPYPLVDGFEWVTMDLNDEKELEDVYQLLFHNYVEDDEAMFRFKYSFSFLNWALKAPGWRQSWHVGVRATQSRKLVAFISAVPITVLLYPSNTDPSASPSASQPRPRPIACSEVNFLCIHKKLRSKRLAPVLIKEITRRCHEVGIWQAIYTGGVLIPTPISTCRYYHRSLDWEKLESVGFTQCPPKSTRQRQIFRFKLPTATSTPGLREMTPADVPQVTELLTRYLARTRVAQQFTEPEVRHWILDESNTSAEKVIFAYVVEDAETRQITDFFSFYRLESTVIGHKVHDSIRAAYLFYYASSTAFAPPPVNGTATASSSAAGKQKSPTDALLKKRLNSLIADALILAKQQGFDVFNALTLLDNPLFLDEQKFGAGDGNLHYYLFNWRMKPVPGGVGPAPEAGSVLAKRGQTVGFADEGERGGVGVVML